MLCKYPQFNKQMGGIHGCGQCLPCRIKKRKERTFRILLETELYEKNSWYTLTYNEKYVPKEAYNLKTGLVYDQLPEGFLTLNPRDIELFIKRVRKKLPPRMFRFFLVGEYGERHFRPHYHLIVFGHGPEIYPTLRDAWTDPISKESYGDLTCDAPSVNDWIAQYSAGYTIKKMTKGTDERLNGRYPEFTRHSLGIGRYAVDRLVDALGGPAGLAHIQTHEDIPRLVSYLGKNWPIDRYLREKIIASLQLTTPLKAAGLSRYQTEMSRLQISHKPDPRFTSSLAHTLQTQYQEENAQKILNLETRANYYQKGDKL